MTYLIAATALAAVILGLIGYARGGAGGWDTVYNTLDLFAGAYTPVSASPPVTLDVARVLALASVLSTAAALIASLSSEWRDNLRLLRAETFVIVCGLDDRGISLAKALSEETHGGVTTTDRRVVLVAASIELGVRRELRHHGIVPFEVDPLDPGALDGLLDRAMEVTAVTADDVANAEIARRSNEYLTAQARVVDCYAFIDDLELCELYREAEEAQSPDGAFAPPEYFNTFENAAKAMIAGMRSRPDSARRTRRDVVVIGDTDLSLAVVLQVARRASADPVSLPTTVSVVADGASASLNRWLESWPELGNDGASLEFRSIDAASGEARAVLAALPAKGQVRREFFVCLEPSGQALRLASWIAGTQPCVGVMAWAPDRPHLHRGIARLAPSLQLIDVEREGTNPLTIRDGVLELLARTAHEWYLAELPRRATASNAGTSASWDELDEETKQNNRDQVRFVREQLLRHDYALRRASASSSITDLPVDLVERLAEAEHERWMSYKESQDPPWSYDAVRDDARRRHPAMLAWERLPETEREKDRDAVRRFNHVVAAIGFRVVGPSAAGRPQSSQD